MNVARMLLSVVVAATSASGAVVIEAAREVSFFDAPAIRVTGLAPLQPVTIRAALTDSAGEAFTSTARFVPHSDGIVDTSRSVANGSYEGIDPMGLFWSLTGKGGAQWPVTGAVETTIDVLDEKDHLLASARIRRRIIPEDVKVRELRHPDSTLVGRFYEHSGGKRPALLTLTGSNGGIDPTMAPFLASRGYNVLALAYYHFEGVSENLIEIPLETFREGLRWLAAQPSVDSQRIGIVGISKGAEAALLTASYFPEGVRAVAAFVPTSVVWEGADARARFGGDAHFDAPGRSSWSLRGKPVPFVRKTVSAERLANRPVAFLDEYEPPIRRPLDPATVIPVEHIRGAIFLAASGDDLVWPSLAMARQINSGSRIITGGTASRSTSTPLRVMESRRPAIARIPHLEELQLQTPAPERMHGTGSSTSWKKISAAGRRGTDAPPLPPFALHPVR
jgi:acetyl esterase/lipase